MSPVSLLHQAMRPTAKTALVPRYRLALSLLNYYNRAVMQKLFTASSKTSAEMKLPKLNTAALQPGGCGAHRLQVSATERATPGTSVATGHCGSNLSNNCGCLQREPAPTHKIFPPFPTRISHISIILAQLHPYSGELAATVLLKHFSFFR